VARNVRDAPRSGRPSIPRQDVINEDGIMTPWKRKRRPRASRAGVKQQVDPNGADAENTIRHNTMTSNTNSYWPATGRPPSSAYQEHPSKTTESVSSPHHDQSASMHQIPHLLSISISIPCNLIDLDLQRQAFPRGSSGKDKVDKALAIAATAVVTNEPSPRTVLPLQQ
jgi:hypothetical protein